MKRLNISIPWTPRTKGRPRFRRAGNKVITYTPKETLDAETQIADDLRAAVRNLKPFDEPVRVVIAMSNDSIAIDVTPTKPHVSRKLRGDVDNYGKLILDALNGVAWTDDSLITDLRMVKV